MEAESRSTVEMMGLMMDRVVSWVILMAVQSPTGRVFRLANLMELEIRSTVPKTELEFPWETQMSREILTTEEMMGPAMRQMALASRWGLSKEPWMACGTLSEELRVS